MSVSGDLKALRLELESLRREHTGWHEDAKRDRKELREILLGDGTGPGFVGRLDRLEQSEAARSRKLRVLTVAFIPLALNAVWDWLKQLAGNH